MRKVKEKKLSRRDPLTPEQRSYCMSRIRSKNTKIEVAIHSELKRRGFKFRKHVRKLPGTPDIVFPKQKLVVFIDGDFWHGRNFAAWMNDLPNYWQNKIQININRDKKNFRILRKSGWKVLRLWEKASKKNLEGAISKIEKHL